MGRDFYLNLYLLSNGSVALSQGDKMTSSWCRTLSSIYFQCWKFLKLYQHGVVLSYKGFFILVCEYTVDFLD
jgi:hypothetical protein